MRYKTNVLIGCVCFLILNPLLLVNAVPSVTDDVVWMRLNSEDPPLLIDVRPKSAYNESHIPTSINVPYTGSGVNQSTIQLIQSYNANETITICSCTDGVNALAIAEDLISQGIDNVFYMSDNFLYWSYDTITGNEPGTINLDSSQNSNNGNEQNNTPNDISPLLILNFIIFSVIGYHFLIKPKLRK